VIISDGRLNQLYIPHHRFILNPYEYLEEL